MYALSNNKRRIPPRPVSVSAMREKEEKHLMEDEDETDDQDEEDPDRKADDANVDCSSPAVGANGDVQGKAAGCSSSGSRYSTRDRKALMQRIHELSSTAHMEIFRMLKRQHVSHTRNKNGMFINLSVVEDNLLDEIASFVDYCIDNSRNLENYDKLLRECRSMHRPEVSGCGGHQAIPASTSQKEEDNSDAEDEPGGEIEEISKTESNPPDLQHSEMHPLLDSKPLPHPRRRRANGDKTTEEGNDAPVADVTREEEDCLLHLRSLVPRDSEKTVTYRRRANTKFALARKRFSKKKNIDKRSSACETDVLSELVPESYVVV